MSQCKKQATLILETGEIFYGKSMGAEGKTIGELVFDTAVIGYQEMLTEKANKNLIIMQTFPMVGNYGINSDCKESEKVWVNGYVTREYCEMPSNFRCEKDIITYMKENNVVGICDIDTRHITKIIRDSGVKKAMITTDENLDIPKIIEEIKNHTDENSVYEVSTKEKYEVKAQNAIGKVAVIDYGVRESMITALNERNLDAVVFPCDVKVEEIKNENVCGIFLSDGPSCPCKYEALLNNLKDILKLNMPVLGVGFGHLALAKVCGCELEKMKTGHRGANQPVYNLENQRTYITTQNHGYIVKNDSIENNKNVTLLYKNANDKTCEGLKYSNENIVSVQFIPDTKTGAVSTSYIYDNFAEKCKEAK